ncbi:YqiJ family protein [Sphingorhabdus arenilitoris]|uniref:YqiJ family protein n=1 Tax=Sphingorhabdus arenilitoris TaxID=1490041 RepID=A0ABV8RDK3_9SPHN
MMFDFWLASENLLFAGSAMLLILLMLLQLTGLGDFGPDMDTDLDPSLDVDGVADGLLAFLGLGRLPIMIWLALFLLAFTLIGYAGQQMVALVIGGLLPMILAGPAAALTALPVTAALARPLARIMPKDETTAVPIDSLIGRFAVIEIGTAAQGSAARAKAVDIHGHSHFIMVEPDNAGQTFVTGEKLLLVRREGHIFKAITQGEQNLPRLEG